MSFLTEKNENDKNDLSFRGFVLVKFQNELIHLKKIWYQLLACGKLVNLFPEGFYLVGRLQEGHSDGFLGSEEFISKVVNVMDRQSSR